MQAESPAPPTQPLQGCDKLKECMSWLLLILFMIKSQHACSAECITSILVALSGSYLLRTDARSNMPKSFKAMMAALQDFGYCTQTFWQYAICPCGSIFRYWLK